MRRELIEPLPVFYRVGPTPQYVLEQLGPANLLKGFRDLSPPSSFGRHSRPVGAKLGLQKGNIASTTMGKSSTLPLSKISRRFQLGGEGAPFQLNARIRAVYPHQQLTADNLHESSQSRTNASTQTEIEAVVEPELKMSDACTSPPPTPEKILPLEASTASTTAGIKLAELEKLTGHIVIKRFFTITKADEAFGFWLERQLKTELEYSNSKSLASQVEEKMPLRVKESEASCSSSRDSIQCECFAKDLEIAAVLQGGLSDEFSETPQPPTDDDVEPVTVLEKEEQKAREVEEEIRSSFIENLHLEDARKVKEHENIQDGDAATLRSVSVDSCIGTATDTSSFGTGPGPNASSSNTLQKMVMDEVLLENEDEEEIVKLQPPAIQSREDKGHLADLGLVSDGGDADESGSDTETETSVQRREEDEFETVIERHEREKEKRLLLRRRNAGIQTSPASTPSSFSSASSSSFDLEVEDAGVSLSQKRRSKGRASYLPGGGSGLHLLHLRFQVGREFESDLSIRIPPPPPPIEKGSKGLKSLWGDVRNKMDSRIGDFVVEGNKVPLYPSAEDDHKEEGDRIERSLRRLKHILDHEEQ